MALGHNECGYVLGREISKIKRVKNLNKSIFICIFGVYLSLKKEKKGQIKIIILRI